VNQAIRADRCEQRAENEESGQVDSHGERVRWDDGHGADVVFARAAGRPGLSNKTVSMGRLNERPRSTTIFDGQLTR